MADSNNEENKTEREQYLDSSIPLLRKEALYHKLHASIEYNKLLMLKSRAERFMIQSEIDKKPSENDTSKK
jgi:hypothetical protein